MPLFYVRGLICERTAVSVLLKEKDVHSARLVAVDLGITGATEVIPENEWEGLNPGEKFIIAF